MTPLPNDGGRANQANQAARERPVVARSEEKETDVETGIKVR